MEAPDFRPVMYFAYIGMAVTAPIWVPICIIGYTIDWLRDYIKTRRINKRINQEVHNDTR